MTIIFFTRRFYPLIGGVEKHVLEIGKRLVKKGYKVIVITERYPGIIKSENLEGVNIIRINAGKNNWFKKIRIWIELFKNLTLIKSADIVHCHDVFFWYLPFRFIFPFKKVFTTFHGYEGNNLPTKKSILMHKIAEKLSFGNICVGDFLKKWYGTNPNFVTYGAVDESLIKLGLKNIKPTKDIVFLGRLEEETGIMKYLQALKLLKESKINLFLDVFGDGSLLNRAKKYALDNNLKVTFKGFITEPEKLLPNYKYIFVSRYLGILEALAVKRPVFAEYNNEIKKDYLFMAPFASYIFIGKDSNQISIQIEDYLEKEKFISMPKAYEWVEKQTWTKTVNIYLQLWNIQ